MLASANLIVSILGFLHSYPESLSIYKSERVIQTIADKIIACLLHPLLFICSRHRYLWLELLPKPEKLAPPA